LEIAVAENGQKNETILAELPELETLCSPCEGEREITEGGRRFRCAVCDGAGYVPTVSGEKVLALVRHNSRPMHEDLEEGSSR
jgi:hypothetical protein